LGIPLGVLTPKANITQKYYVVALSGTTKLVAAVGLDKSIEGLITSEVDKVIARGKT